MLKALNIMLVEDNVDHAELMIATFKKCNVANKIIHHSRGQAAIDYLVSISEAQHPTEASMPQLILLDIKMPSLSGIDVLKTLKSDERFHHIPVLMVTSSASDTEIEMAYSIGAASYIVKPIEYEDFSKKISELNLYWVLTAECPGK